VSASDAGAWVPGQKRAGVCYRPRSIQPFSTKKGYTSMNRSPGCLSSLKCSVSVAILWRLSGKSLAAVWPVLQSADSRRNMRNVAQFLCINRRKQTSFPTCQALRTRGNRWASAPADIFPWE